jgi:1-deoxy-D-xylulose-5-phosphate reductoisomerase
MKKRIFISGITGALGSEAVRVIRDHIEFFDVVGFSGFKNADRIIKLCKEFRPHFIGISSELMQYVSKECDGVSIFDSVRDLDKAILELKPDITLFLSAGISALYAIFASLKEGLTVGIGNKESIIAGGKIIFSEDFKNRIIPIDSEPSAIYQCLLGENVFDVKNIIITASGGPFWDTNIAALPSVSPDAALNHPNWKMGKKITIDSATMANKAFEVIEAHFLFDMPYKKIRTVVHRESIVHSLVEFRDGNIKALLSPTRMYYPIQFAMFYPERMENTLKNLNLADVGKLTFQEMDYEKFPAFTLILNIAKNEDNLPALVAADEVAVNAFLENKIRFTDIPLIISETFDKYESRRLSSLSDVEAEYKKGIMIANDILRRRHI